MKKLNIIDTDGKLYYVGGVVRDELLGIKSFDVDIVCVGDAIEYCSKFGRVIRKNPDFGTVRVEIEGEEVDFASTRSEIYPQAGHLPVVDEIGCPLKKDVLRRDFTINALAKSFKTGEIIDYTGGLDDIKLKKLRILHDKSFIDDPTRIVRGLKFSVRFGFTLDKKTRRLQEEYLQNVNYDMSYKRLKKEFSETFNLNSDVALEKFYSEKIYKLLDKIEPQKPITSIKSVIDFMKDKGCDFNALWLIYLGGFKIEVLEKLELTREEMRIIRDFESIKNAKLTTDFKIHKVFSSLLPETLAIYAGFVGSAPVFKYISKLKDVKLSITGKDLKQLGLTPSGKFKTAFDEILKVKLKNPNLTHEEELDIAKRIIG